MIRYIKIAILSGSRDGEVLHFVRYPQDDPYVLTFGRRETCNVSLANDSQISRDHAKISIEGEQAWLEDLQSRNGTFLRDKDSAEVRQVRGRVQLDSGDTFKVGRTWLLYEASTHDINRTTSPSLSPNKGLDD